MTALFIILSVVGLIVWISNKKWKALCDLDELYFKSKRRKLWTYGGLP